jgi:hypothetical protein
MEAKEQDIRKLHSYFFTDRQIAETLAITSRTVLRWRKTLKLPAVTNGGWEFIRDKDKARAQARIAWHTGRRLANG